MHGPKEPSSTPWPCPSTILHRSHGAAAGTAPSPCALPARREGLRPLVAPPAGLKAKAAQSRPSHASSRCLFSSRFLSVGTNWVNPEPPTTPQLPRALPQGRERTPAAQGEAPGGRAHPEPPAASCARRPAGQGSGGCAPPGRRSPGAVPGRPTFRGAPWPAAGNLGESRGGVRVGTQPRGWHGPQPSQGTGMRVLGALGVPPHPHSPAYALALALAARVPWDSGRVFTIRCLVLRASRAAGRVAHCQAAPHGHGARLSQGVCPGAARRGVPPLPSHPAGCLEQYLLWGWRRCPGRAYHPPT